MTNKRYYRDFEGENGTIIRDRITNEEVFEFGLSDSKDLCGLLNEQEETIQSLKKELFESEKDYIMETYSDNPIRRDEKIQSLKEEFKARFGDVE